MQIAQRVILMMTIAITALFFYSTINENNTERFIEQWQKIKVESFLQRAIRDQELSIEEYMKFIRDIAYFDDTTEINLELYQKEWDIDGGQYYLLVLQDEILRNFEQIGKVELEESVLGIVIQRDGNEYRYYMEIFGKDDR